MKWYKIFKEDDTHHGFTYVDGLNIDVKEFRKVGSCVSGGLYFSNAKNIWKFFDYGDYIREVEIPAGSRYVIDPQGSKWRSERLFLHSRRSLKELDTWIWMRSRGIKFNYSDFRYRCGKVTIGLDNIEVMSKLGFPMECYGYRNKLTKEIIHQRMKNGSIIYRIRSLFREVSYLEVLAHGLIVPLKHTVKMKNYADKFGRLEYRWIGLGRVIKYIILGR